MTHPDPRLLVPRSAVPFFPLGARIWPLTWEPEHPYEESSFARTYRHGEDDAVLDLSAPTLRDGVPEWVDALPWALHVLGRRHAHGEVPILAARYILSATGGREVALRDQEGMPVLWLSEVAPPVWHTHLRRVLVVGLLGPRELATRDVGRAMVASALRMPVTTPKPPDQEDE